MNVLIGSSDSDLHFYHAVLDFLSGGLTSKFLLPLGRCQAIGRSMKPFGLNPALGLVLILTACGAPATPQPVAASQTLPAPIPAPATATVASVAPTASQESLTIDFGQNGIVLSEVASAQLDGAAQLYRDARPEVMIVSGHSDKTGREFDNLILSARRADMVKKALVDRGIPAERLQIIAVGEAEPVASVAASRSAVVTWR